MRNKKVNEFRRILSHYYLAPEGVSELDPEKGHSNIEVSLHWSFFHVEIIDVPTAAARQPP